jgi:Dyp-type peroxidase family
MNAICAFFNQIKEISMNLRLGTGIHLDQPLAWKTANPDEQKLLENMQGNILKGHGRDFTFNIFFRLGTDIIKSKRVLREIANFHLTNAYQQLLDTEEYKATKKSGGGFGHLALTYKGYQVLGLAAQSPTDSDFQMGMKATESINALNDPSVDRWEESFRKDIHGVLLAADTTQDGADKFAQILIKLLQNAGAEIIQTQAGEALRNQVGEGIEHFGYVDGRSQPLLLVEDITQEATMAGTSRWNPAFPLSTALVPDPGVDDPYSFGSYFIFRKLEQNVRGFKDREQQIATELGLEGEARELAGAMIVGRFEDGTPVTLSDEARKLKPPNDFNYNGDSGSRCPFHAHIRKVNARGSGGAEPESEERKHLMPRRGIPFADQKREVLPSELPEVESYDEFKEKVFPKLPEGGVGLLFMAYNSDIGQQFKFTQQLWANNTKFPAQPDGPHGIDPVIGQGADSNGNYPSEWDNPPKGKKSANFAGFVQFKGGDYFFVPSLTFLKNL